MQPSAHEQVALTPLAAAPRVAPRAPAALSVTAVTTYARCPKQFYWTVVRPLPRRASAAARIGTEVHRWIEQRADRQLVLVPLDQPAVPAEPAAVGSGDPVLALRASFLASPFADLDPERVETPFVLALGRHLVRGRIDAVYRRDGFLELVDFKTGRLAHPDDRSGGVQLDLYALAAVSAWDVDPTTLRTTYCHLRAEGPPELRTTTWDPALVGQVRSRMESLLDALDSPRYPARAGPWCQRCDFVSFCAPGRAWRDAAGAPES